MNGYYFDFDHSEVCARCGKTYGCHYGVQCFMRDEDPEQKKTFVHSKRGGIDNRAICFNCGKPYRKHYNGLCFQAHNSSFFVPAKTDQFIGETKMTSEQAKSLIDDVAFYLNRAVGEDLPEITLIELWEKKGYIVEED